MREARKLLIALLVLLFATTAAAAEKFLRIGVTTLPIDLGTPYGNIVIPSLLPALAIYDPIVMFDDNGDVVPALATSWDMISPTVWRFKLREGVRFSNGEPFNAQAAAAALNYLASQAGLLELTHNWVTETDAEFKYHDGNAQPQGFGHICFSVPDLDAAVKWFDDNQVIYVKRPDQGKMKDVAFIKDPDGYWIEIVEPGKLKNLGL